VTGVRPRVLAAVPGVFPSTIINVAKPLLRLHEAGAIDLDLSFHFLVRRRQIERADLLVMSHTIDPGHVWMLDCARDAGTPLLYDIDENLLEPPDGEPGLAFHRAPARQAAVRRALSQAALVRTYAPALARYLEPLSSRVVRADGPVEWQLVPAAPAQRSNGRVHVVYATSRLQDGIGSVLAPPLRRVLDEHTNVDVTIWGPRFAALEGHPRVRFRNFIRDYDRYFALFARAGFDIGLAPMPDELFYQCKTATKFREYAACGIAGIYADTEMYRDCVTDGEAGLLVSPQPSALCPSDSDPWSAAISRLVQDPALRARIQERALAYARERFATARIEGDWLAHIKTAIERQPARARVTGANHPAEHPSLVAGLLRYAGRGVSLLSSGGVRAVAARARAQLASMRQLVAWELALRRMRHDHK
jgi:hypothetical protein